VHKVHDLAPGKSHELWVIPASGGAPVSLGLLPHTGDHHRVLTAAQRAALAGAKTIAVSLEPEGGSPNGSPTQVLLTAPITAA
jgi:anti-sigma-K factor RskA